DADQYQPMLDECDRTPALLVGRRSDVVAGNRGATVLYGDRARVDPERRNVLWLVFTSEQVRATADDWEAEAARTVAFFRAQVGAAVDEPAVARLVAELEAASPDFARIWSRRELAARPTDRRTVHHPALGRVEFRLTKMRTLDDEHTLVAFLAPPGSGAADRLAALVAPDHGWRRPPPHRVRRGRRGRRGHRQAPRGRRRPPQPPARARHPGAPGPAGADEVLVCGDGSPAMSLDNTEATVAALPRDSPSSG